MKSSLSGVLFYVCESTSVLLAGKRKEEGDCFGYGFIDSIDTVSGTEDCSSALLIEVLIRAAWSRHTLTGVAIRLMRVIAVLGC